MSRTVLPPDQAVPITGNLLDFLGWLAARPRKYAEVMEAWRTSCPRLSVWEDALDGGFVHLEPDGAVSQGEVAVLLTSSGMALLNDYRPLNQKFQIATELTVP